MITAKQVQPGQRVSVDHFVWATRGRLFRFGHKASTFTEIYTVEVASLPIKPRDMFDVAFQLYLKTHETIQSLDTCVEWRRDADVVPSAVYHRE